MSTRKRSRSSWRRFLCRRLKGQTILEYALILVLVSIVAISALRSIFGKTSEPFTNTANAFP